MLARIDHSCALCGSLHRMGRINMDFSSPMKCRVCGRWVCSSCIGSNSEAKKGNCPLCGGKLFTPLFG